MRANLFVILSAVAAAALLASSATARIYRSSYYGYYGSPYGGSYGPYSPSLPTPRYGPSGDFQNGSRG